MNKTNEYNATSIRTLEGLEAIALRPGMFIGDTDSDGLHHLLIETISNSIDEAINGFGNEIIITVEGAHVTVQDFGRGIPFGEMANGKEAIIELCTQLHSGGKFGQGAYSVSGGLHGIGLSAVNALSENFSITSNRDDMQCDVYFNEGKLIGIDKTPVPTQRSGSIVSFSPSPSIFHKTTWDEKTVKTKIEELSYLTAGVKFVLNWNGKTTVFLSKNGLKDMIASKMNDGITNIIHMRQEKDGYDVEIALQYTKDGNEKIYAYTNNIPNADGGTHVTGFKAAFTSAFNKMLRAQGLLEEKDENFTGEMIRNGMIAAINIKMQIAPQFTNQTKDKLTSPEARTYASATVTALLEKALSKADIKTIFERALMEKKAEDAAKRAKEAANKISRGGKNMNALKDLPEKLADCSSRNGELFLTEGDSAAGGAKVTRNKQTQAVLALRGKVLNTFSKELADIVHNQEIRDILTCLGCGIGENFNINNLRYEKIIIMADADPDGHHIELLLLSLFLRHLPDLVIQGQIYIAVPPLYRVVNNRGTNYYYSDADVRGKSGEITRFKGLGEMTPQELYETTLNPETRQLMQLIPENIDNTLNLFETLMGKSSLKRRDFILNHRISNIDGDVYETEDDE